jgi:hypothetical protein
VGTDLCSPLTRVSRTENIPKDAIRKKNRLENSIVYDIETKQLILYGHFQGMASVGGMSP